MKRILIVDDNPYVRQGTRRLLRDDSELTVIDEAVNGAEGIEKTQRLRPDLVLMDIRMPGMDGLSAVAMLKENCPEIPVIILTSHETDDYVVEAMANGAAGYLIKGTSRELVLQRIHDVLEGRSGLDPDLAARVLARLSSRIGAQKDGTASSSPRAPKPSPLISRLSPQERITLSLIAEGKTNPQIAAEMHVAVSTVKDYVAGCIRKLGVSDRVQAAVTAVKMGLLEHHNL